MRIFLAFFLASAFALPTQAQEWTNSGGNAQRNGQSDAYGPLTAQLAWSGARSSIIAWQPVIAGDRVFVVRQTGFPPSGEPNGSPLVCLDLASGNELWFVHVPYNTGDWTTHVLGVSQGKVYATRAGNGASVSARVYAYDQVTGQQVWVSQELVDIGAYDGCVFEPGGDLVIASFRDVWRLRANDGTTAWRASRAGSVSGSCGAASYGNAVYVVDASPAGNVFKRFDLASGAFQYASAAMAGFTVQQTPMVGPDGTLYLNRTQNNVTVDFFHAFTDTGSAFVPKWSVASQWTTNSEFAVGRDDSIYMLQPGEILTALDPTNGAVRHTYATPLGYANPRMLVDADGRLYVSNGGFSTGRVYAFDPDLTLRWSLPVTNVNIGGPALGHDGTLVIAGVATNVRAYRTPSPWSTVSGGIAGTGGVPSLRGRGTLTAHNDVLLDLSSGPPNAPTTLVFGDQRLDLPLLGGLLVPNPVLQLAGLTLDANGATTVRFSFPRGVPTGATFWFQAWLLDASAPFAIAASDGLRAITP